ncbi:MAG TPA: DUF6625 family protein [Roseateles sp.]
MKRVLLIVDYFGRWPEWMEVFLLSCAHNRSIDWLIHTDCPLPALRPDNVRFVSQSFEDYCRKASDRLDLRFSPYEECPSGKGQVPQYNNLCDLRPCYGDLHAEAIAGYDYFGWCDIDVVFGNLRSHLGPEVLNKNLVTFSGSLCSGHFTLLKNTPEMRRMYRDIPRWRQRIEGRHGRTPWEDCLDEAWLSRLCSPADSYFCAEAPARGVAPEVMDRYRRDNAFIREWVTPFIPWEWVDGQLLHPEVWYWRSGDLTNWRDGHRPFPYLHLMNFKQHRYVNEELHGLQATWGPSHRVDPTVLAADVIRIDRAGIVGLSHEEAAADRRQLREHRRLAASLDLSGLNSREALQALAAAGASWRQGVLQDRACVVPPDTRRALWQAVSNRRLAA